MGARNEKSLECSHPHRLVQLARGLLGKLRECQSGLHCKTCDQGLHHKAQTKVERATQSAKTEQCYEGSSQVTLPDGNSFEGGASMVRRSLNEQKATIVEEVISTDARSKEKKLYVVEMQVTGNEFKMKERAGAFEGTGTLEGDAWQWTAWTSKARMPDGTVVNSKDRLEGAGLKADKVVRGAEGQVLVNIQELYKTTDCARFSAALDSLKK